MLMGAGGVLRVISWSDLELRRPRGGMPFDDSVFYAAHGGAFAFTLLIGIGIFLLILGDRAPRLR